MSRFAVAIFTVIFSSACVYAQSSAPPRLQVFAGYALFHADSGGVNSTNLATVLGAPPGSIGPTTNYNGWNAEVQYNAGRTLGLVAEVSGRYGRAFTAAANSGISGLPFSQGYTFLVGPRFAIRPTNRITPFIHALGGVDRWSLESTTLSSTNTRVTPTVTDTNVALVVGGGVDYKYSPRYTIRPFQVDYVYTDHNLNTIYGDVFGPGNFLALAPHENNLRLSAGIVLHF